MSNGKDGAKKVRIQESQTEPERTDPAIKSQPSPERTLPVKEKNPPTKDEK